MSKIVGTAIALGTILGFAAPAQAALVSCPASFTTDGTAKVHDGTGARNTAASDCQYDDSTDNNDVANLDNINASAFFGFDDWESNQQMQIDTPNQSTGTWSILNVDFDDFDYMMVFKSGQNTHLTAFLFNEIYSSGGWSTPFTEPPFSFPGNATSRDVSHYSIVRRPDAGGTGGEVPEPAAIGLFGLGLLGLGTLRRRKI